MKLSSCEPTTRLPRVAQIDLVPWPGSFSDQSVERPATATERDQGQQQSRPAEMRRPGVGIDENLDHQRHAPRLDQPMSQHR